MDNENELSAAGGVLPYPYKTTDDKKASVSVLSVDEIKMSPTYFLLTTEDKEPLDPEAEKELLA